MNRCRWSEMVNLYADHELSGAQRAEMDAHLAQCEACREELAKVSALSRTMSQWQAPEAPKNFEALVRERIVRSELEKGEAPMEKKRLVWVAPSLSLALVLVVSLIAMKAYVQRGFGGRIKNAVEYVDSGTVKVSADAVGLPLSPGHASVNRVASQYEPYYLKSEFQRSKSQGTQVSQWSVDKGVMNAAPARFGAESIGSPAGYLTYGLSDRSAGMQEFNTEEYDRVYENEFLEAINNPLSTFSIDVDTASYSNVRRYLSGNQLPPKDAVRIEEMINYFTYQYPQPQGAEPFSITTEMAACPWNAQHQLLLVGLQGRTMETKDLPASNLVFLVDVSGSMDRPNKLPLVQSAFKLLANQLRQQDKVSIVVYAGAAGLVLDSASGDQKAQILAAIDELKAGGSTAGGAGIQLAYEVAKKNFIKDGNNRVILATDGDFNVGVSSTSELERIIEEKRGDGIFLTVLGFGDGNYKDSRMETLADKGNGNLAYIDTMLEAKKVFVNQLTGTLFTIAKDVKIQVEFNPSKVKAYRLVGYENRMLKKEDFNNDKKDAGEIGAGHTVTALYEIVPAGSSEAFDKVDDLKYQKTTVTPSDELLTVKIRYKEPKEDVSKLLTRQVTGKAGDSAASNNLQFASAVAEFGMLLRDSQFKGTSTYQEALAQAKAAKGTDDDGFRADFIKMIEMAQMISGKQ